MTWEEARLTCQNERGDLVAVEKPEINEWIAKSQERQLWIGASDKVISCMKKKTQISKKDNDV